MSHLNCRYSKSIGNYIPLDENQKYHLVRRCIISFFAKDLDKLAEFGYDVATDFEPTMTFVRDLYYESLKRKVDAQNA